MPVQAIPYNEAARYLENAAKTLSRDAGKMDGHYTDPKYVKTACGTAYSGVLYALDAYLEKKGVTLQKKKGRISKESYQQALAKLDRKLLGDFNTAYEVLHLAGYYDGATDYELIRLGFQRANSIINRIKPAGIAGLSFS